MQQVDLMGITIKSLTEIEKEVSMGVAVLDGDHSKKKNLKKMFFCFCHQLLMGGGVWGGNHVQEMRLGSTKLRLN